MGGRFDYPVRPLWLHSSRTCVDLGVGRMAEIAFASGLSRMENRCGFRWADARFRYWSACRGGDCSCGRDARKRHKVFACDEKRWTWRVRLGSLHRCFFRAGCTVVCGSTYVLDILGDHR